MTKQAFLSELKRELSQAQESLYEEILADINDHFAAGAAQGKTEEEICQSLGQPGAIAAQVLEEIGVTPPPPHTPPVPPMHGNNNNDFGSNNYNDYSNVDQVYDGVANIVIDQENSQLRFLPSQTEQVRVTIKNADSDYSTHMEMKNNGTLYVQLKLKRRFRAMFNWGNNNGNKVETTVYVPAQFMGKITANSSAGSIKASGISGNIDFDTSAGSITLEDHRGSDIRLDSSAGSIKAYLKNSVVENVDIDTSAGSVVVEAEETRRLKVDTSAGSVTVNVRKLGGDTKLDTSAGSIRLTAYEVEGNINLDSSAGSITANLPYDANCRIKAEKPSIGSLNNKLAGNPNSPYTLRASSNIGSINLLPVQ